MSVRITAQAVARETEVELTFRPNVINETPNRASPCHGHGATTSKPILGEISVARFATANKLRCPTKIKNQSRRESMRRAAFR
jgi:hypothetical protein